MKSTSICTKIATIEPSGYVCAANANEFKDQLTSAVASSSEFSVLLVDMKQVEFIDSAGLMALVSAFRLAQSIGKRFSLCSVAPSIQIVFELTQLDGVFDIFDSRDAFEALLS